MKVSILGIEFHSPNKGCGALAYSICDIISDLAKEQGEELQINAFVINPEPVAGVNDYELNCIKYQLKSPGFWKSAFKVFKESDFIIDFSLGDSFADIYGASRFYKHSMLKLCAIFSGKPYILGPQTYGPFTKTLTKKVAKYILKKSKVCFARDDFSSQYVYELCKKEAILTTDVAFALKYEETSKEKRDIIKIGINPSGLLWDGREFISTTKITVDYKEYIMRIMDFLTESGQYEVHLIPHVFSADENSPENDYRACKEINKLYPSTVIAPLFSTPMEAKGYISGMDVFSGARMHATIAALSSGVVTIPFSYSRKFEGLFGELDYPFTISATKVDTDEAVRRTKEWIADSATLQKHVDSAKSIVAQKQSYLNEKLTKIIKENR